MSGAGGVPLLSLAIGPKTPDDAQRLADALRHFTADDPDLRVRAGQLTGEVVIEGRSEQHLEGIVNRLRDAGVEAGIGRPEVVYRGAVTRPAHREAKYAKQAGGRGQYGHVKIRLYPGASGTGYVFENHVMPGAIPAEFIPAVHEGIRDTLVRGVPAGHPIDDVRVELYDGSYHNVDSTEASFRIAGALAAQEAARAAEPVLLEPVMRVEAVVPAECRAAVMKDLLSRRGRIHAGQDRGDTYVIRALAPLRGLSGYADDLRAHTRGRGTCTIQFDRYIPLREADDEDGRDSVVGAPRRPAPTPRDAGVALPEPDE